MVIVFVVLAIYLYCRRRMEAIIECASSVVDLAAKKQGLEAEIEQCMKSLDENREELRKLDAERKQPDRNLLAYQFKLLRKNKRETNTEERPQTSRMSFLPSSKIAIAWSLGRQTRR